MSFLIGACISKRQLETLDEFYSLEKLPIFLTKTELANLIDSKKAIASNDCDCIQWWYLTDILLLSQISWKSS